MFILTDGLSEMAATNSQQTHRPGVLKQQNKAHKHGKHKSKGSSERETKGRAMFRFRQNYPGK